MNIEAIRIDETGKASDMSFETIMSADGCNPVSKDEEMKMAHDSKEAFLPVIYPAVLPGAAPGVFNGAVVPAVFPGVNLYSTR